MIRWGVMGLGKIANTFASEFEHITGGKIIFAASRENEKAGAFARQYQIDYWGSYEACLQHKEVDVVYISTPHNLHFELAKQALLHGKHVLCEKPITVFPEQLAELMTLAAKKGLFLMDAMWTYFLPAVKHALHWYKEGKIGQVRQVSAAFAFPAVFNPQSRLFSSTLAGGCMLDIGIYPIYFAFLVLGKNYISLKANGLIGQTGVEESIAISLSYPSAMATLYASFKHRGVNDAFIFGENGYIQLPLFWKSDSVSLYSESGALMDEFHDHRECHGFAYQVNHVMECINSGLNESPVVPLGLSYEVQLTMQEVRNQLGLHTQKG